jgi:hypothetical protein
MWTHIFIGLLHVDTMYRYYFTVPVVLFLVLVQYLYHSCYTVPYGKSCPLLINLIATLVISYYIIHTLGTSINKWRVS